MSDMDVCGGTTATLYEFANNLLSYEQNSYRELSLYRNGKNSF